MSFYVTIQGGMLTNGADGSELALGKRGEGAVAEQFQAQRAFEAGFDRKSPLLWITYQSNTSLH